MTSRSMRRIAVALWLAILVVAIVVIARARFTADLSAFLPTTPTREQALLIDQLREGPASHLILASIDGDAQPLSDAALAALSKKTAASLRGDPRFLSINNGEATTAARDRELLFNHRYLLSDRVASARFTPAGLHDALVESLDLLSSSAGLMLQPLISRDPTAELVHLVDALTAGRDLPLIEGVWIARTKAAEATTAQGGNSHALLIAETRAAGSDIDGQQEAIRALRGAFDAAKSAATSQPGLQSRSNNGSNNGSNAAFDPSVARLVLSGPPVFAVDARNTIEREATRLSIIGATLVALLLSAVYRSVRALVLGMLPMISGALCGLAVVAAGFGVIHGITLGFGVTLIGEAVDYAIYLFVQGAGGGDAARGRAGFWSTIALGVATSVIGFAALIFSGFQGLAQIGILSIVGLVVAASVTRWVLPVLMPVGFAVRPMPSVGRALAAASARASALRWPLLVLAAAACIVLFLNRERIWSDDLASLSPVTKADQATDRRLRSELGAPDVRDLVVVVARNQENALLGSERVVAALAPLITDGSLAGVDAPSRYLPSEATQRARQKALPDDATLRANFARALDGLPFSKAGFDGFFDDAAREKNGPLVTRADLEGSSLAIGTRALLSHREGDRQWTALVALRSPLAEGAAANDVPRARIAAALAPLRNDANAAVNVDADVEAKVEIRAIDITADTQQLYVGYLSEAVRAAALGVLEIVVLLAFALRDARRLGRVLVPLALAVVLVAAAQVALAGPLTLFHLVGLLLIVAVGSNYALFFDRRTKMENSSDARTDEESDDRALLTSLVVANLTAVIGFGVLGFSSLPVLHSIGSTVAPGALLALSLAAVFAAAKPRPAPATMAFP